MCAGDEDVVKNLEGKTWRGQGRWRGENAENEKKWRKCRCGEGEMCEKND